MTAVSASPGESVSMAFGIGEHEHVGEQQPAPYSGIREAPKYGVSYANSHLNETKEQQQPVIVTDVSIGTIYVLHHYTAC
jgi:hypothetical protein